MTVTDSETCSAISETVSIKFNADLAVQQGRMTSHEQQGWYRLATLTLDRVPTRGAGAVNEKVTALQAAVPPVALSAPHTAQIGSEEWQAVLPEVVAACAEAGSEVPIVSFTGGSGAQRPTSVAPGLGRRVGGLCVGLFLFLVAVRARGHSFAIALLTTDAACSGVVSMMHWCARDASHSVWVGTAAKDIFATLVCWPYWQ